MVIGQSPHSPSRRVYGTRKHFFFTLLLLNSFLGCIYVIHERNQLTQSETTSKSPLWNHLFNQQSFDGSSTKALQSIREILENEYNHHDLLQFYHLVQTEYSLGLRCTRQQTKTSTSTRSPIVIRNSRRFQRKDLYKYLIDNSEICATEPVDLLIVIISKSENYKTRDAIRRTWASNKNLGIYSSINVKYMFLLDFDEKLAHQIRLENELFHDIIQVELPQQYTLVTHRVLSLFEWSFRFCRSAKYFFKTDDDIFINLILLLKFVSPLIEQPMDKSFVTSDMHMYGYRHAKPIVFRSALDPVVARYIVTKDEFPCEFYPDFLSGFGYLISKKARDAIVYTAYQDAEPFRISDVYLTGIIPDYLSIPRQSLSNYHIRYDGDCENYFNQTEAFACAAGFHYGNSSDVFERFYRYWQLIRSTLLVN